MHRRFLIIIAIIALVVVAGVTVGLVSTRAQGEAQLPTITPAQLLANVAQHAGEVTAVSGDVSWKNDVLGLSMFSFGGQGTGDLSALLASGSGRLWTQNGKVRFEIQGIAGDTTIVGDSAGVWVYTYASNTATEYTLPARSESPDGSGQTSTTQPGSTGQASQTTVTDPLVAIDDFIQKLAPDATLAVSDSVNVAGRTCYVLSLIPKATNTAFGSAQVAIDGETYVPLKLDVYARGTAKPVLTAGFTSVSYSKLDDGLFTFTPPPNATVQHKTLTLPALTLPAAPAPQGASEQAPLTLEEAAAKAGFTPPVPQISDPALAFAGAYVIPAETIDVQSLLDQLGASANSEGSAAPIPLPAGEINLGPTVIQRYGEGFGTVVLIETKTPADLSAQLEQMLAAVPLLSHAEAEGVTIYQLNTALGSAALWNKDGLLFIAAGSVSQTDLTGFIAGVR